jgi:hypothetical protein
MNYVDLPRKPGALTTLVAGTALRIFTKRIFLNNMR